MARLFEVDTYFDDMPATIKGYIDGRMDSHKAQRDRPESWLAVDQIDAQRDQIGRLFKIQAKLRELQEAISEYEGISGEPAAFAVPPAKGQ